VSRRRNQAHRLRGPKGLRGVDTAVFSDHQQRRPHGGPATDEAAPPQRLENPRVIKSDSDFENPK
jgi:hypothetical protein